MIFSQAEQVCNCHIISEIFPHDSIYRFRRSRSNSAVACHGARPHGNVRHRIWKLSRVQVCGSIVRGGPLIVSSITKDNAALCNHLQSLSNAFMVWFRPRPQLLFASRHSWCLRSYPLVAVGLYKLTSLRRKCGTMSTVQLIKDTRIYDFQGLWHNKVIYLLMFFHRQNNIYQCFC